MCKLNDVLTIDEIVHMWGIKETTVRYYLDRGYIRFRETATGRKLVHKTSAIAYLGQPMSEIEMNVYRAKNQTGLITGSLGNAGAAVAALEQEIEQLNLALTGARVSTGYARNGTCPNSQLTPVQTQRQELSKIAQVFIPKRLTLPPVEGPVVYPECKS